LLKPKCQDRSELFGKASWTPASAGVTKERRHSGDKKPCPGLPRTGFGDWIRGGSMKVEYEIPAITQNSALRTQHSALNFDERRISNH